MRCHIVALSTALLGSTLCAAQPQYTITELGNFIPTSINDLGQVVGYTFPSGGQSDPVLWQNGTLTILQDSVFHLNAAHSINNQGQIVGSIRQNNFAPPGLFLYQAGVVTPIDLPGWVADFRFYYHINNRGQIVGQSDKRAFLYDAGDVTLLDVGPAPEFSSAYSVNDSGQIVGHKQTSSSGGQGFLYDAGQVSFFPYPAIDINNHGQVMLGSAIYENGTLTPLGLLPPIQPDVIDRGLRGQAINDSAQIVGNYSENVPYFDGYELNYYSLVRGFVWDPANGIRDIHDLLGVSPTDMDNHFPYLVDINNSGQILGYGSGGAFLLTPIPEPALATLLLAPLSLLLRNRAAHPPPRNSHIFANKTGETRGGRAAEEGRAEEGQSRDSPAFPVSARAASGLDRADRRGQLRDLLPGDRGAGPAAGAEGPGVAWRVNSGAA